MNLREGKRKASEEKGLDGKKSKIEVNKFVLPNWDHLTTLLGFFWVQTSGKPIFIPPSNPTLTLSKLPICNPPSDPVSGSPDIQSLKSSPSKHSNKPKIKKPNVKSLAHRAVYQRFLASSEEGLKNQVLNMENLSMGPF